MQYRKSTEHHRRKDGKAFRHDDKPRVWYVADFETNVTPETCAANPVWAWGLAKVGDDGLRAYGTSIDSFMRLFWEHDSIYSSGFIGIYFHNLNFDGEFILSWLLSHGWYQASGDFKPKSRSKAFYCLRNNGKLYQIEFAFKTGARVILWDSWKKLPMSVRNLSKAFGLSYTKGDIDYEIYREPGHELTPEELDYLKRDVVIVAQALDHIHNGGIRADKMTMGADAYADWETRARNKNPDFDADYNSLEYVEWQYAKQAYRGGLTLVNPKYRNRRYRRKGRVYDVNSMYPSVMRYNPMPYGNGTRFEGKPEFAPNTFTIFEVIAHFERRKNQIAVYRPKGYSKTWPQGTFVESTYNELEAPIHITLSSVDWETYSKHYEITVVEWLGGYVYQTRMGTFDDYIDYWIAEKIKAAEEGNKPKKTIAKFKLNNLYGKLGQSIDNTFEFYASLNKEGVVVWHKRLVDCDENTTYKYMPMAVAITAYARAKLCQMIRAAGNRFIYADTDSVHIFGDYEIPNIDCHPTRLGAWDCESHFSGGKWIRAKAYAEYINNAWQYKLAGCPAACLGGLPIEQFYVGAEYHPKLLPKRTQGGIILVDCGYKFKESAYIG